MTTVGSWNVLVTIGLATGGGLSDRAFFILYRTLNAVCERLEFGYHGLPFPPLAVVVHVSGPITNWGAPKVGRVLWHRKPRRAEVPVVIDPSEWEDLPRESHREVLARRIGEGVAAIVETFNSSDRESAQAMLSFWNLAVEAFRAEVLPVDELLGPPARCPRCGGHLRTPLAKQCRHCGANWH